MATVSHLAVGALCGAVYARKTSARAVVAVPAFAALAASPDLDFLAMGFGSEGTPLEHRVMTHALPVAAVVGVALGQAFGPKSRKLFASLMCVLTLASHGIIDSLTSTGLPPRLWWPFTWRRFGFFWQPIPGTRSYQEYFTSVGLHVIAVELLYCVPVLAATWWILRGGREAVRDEPRTPTRELPGRRALPTNE